MKQQFLLSLILLPLISLGQDDIKTSGFYYKASLASTLTVNEEYTLTQDDETGPLLIPSAFFFNNTVGYRFDERSVIGLNIEYNWHSESGLHFMPLHFSFRYNLISDDDNVFIRTGYGRILNIGKSFETGTMYKIGSGVELFNENYTNSCLIGIDFHRKRFGHKQLEKLSSISIFFEFMLF